MIDVVAKTGLVGFFDILGYQEMLLASDVSSTARSSVGEPMRFSGNLPSDPLEHLYSSFVANDKDVK